MISVYPIILSKGSEKGYVAYSPDLEINSEGNDIADAIVMMRDAIGLWGLSQEDLGKAIPASTNFNPEHNSDEIVALVDIDFDVYKRQHSNKAVRKNLTIPAWLNEMAEQNNINFSQVLQNSLKEILNIE